MVTRQQTKRRSHPVVLLGATVAALVMAGGTAWGAPEPDAPNEPEQAEAETPTAEPAAPDAPPASEEAALEPPARTEAERPKQDQASGLPAEDSDTGPYVLHAPPATAEVDEPLQIDAALTHPHQVKRAYLVFRSAGAKGFRAVEFRRGTPGPYVAILPAEAVRPPGVHYTIELELRDGRRVAVFASRRVPHRVLVAEDSMDVIEREVAKRVDDRRAVFWSGGEYVSFGRSVAEVETERGLVKQDVDDNYYRIEGGFTYRPLRTVSEFGIRAGIVRGSAPVPVRDLLPGQEEGERFDVGLNYGAPWIRFRFADIWHGDASLLVNVTEVGFSAGAGAILHIGDPYGSKLSLGVEAIQEFGTRVFSQVDIQAHDRVRVAPIIEVTNMPSADQFGMRLVGEVGVDIGWGFVVVGRGGYQARLATSGGPAAGGSLSYAF